MKASFPPALAYVLAHEGGYCKLDGDPGGATNRGVTQAVYDDWRRAHGLRSQSVRLLTDGECEGLYRKLYWDKVRGDDLPAGVDYATFDFAVNSGAARAARFLQEIAGVAADGKIGPVTLAAVNNIPPLLTIRELCSARLDYLRHLETFDRFGRGWTSRVNEVRAQAEAMAR